MFSVQDQYGFGMIRAGSVWEARESRATGTQWNTQAKRALSWERLPAAPTPTVLTHLPVNPTGSGPGGHKEDTHTDLVLFMDRTESAEEELNDGQVIIACGHVQTGIASLRTEIKP